MISPPSLSRVFVVLARPRFGGNVGACARAVKNMGLGGLVLAGAEDLHAAEARMMAAEAQDVLEAAPRLGTLAQALAPFAVSFAATRRVQRGRTRVLAAREAAAHLAREMGEESRAALVFGCEESGLSAAEVALCHGVLSIPSSPAYPSLNLAAAVMVAAYEVRMALTAAAEGALHRPPPGEKERGQMLEQMEAALDLSGFFAANPRGRVLLHLREILAAGARTAQDARLLRGVFRRINQGLRPAPVSGAVPGAWRPACPTIAVDVIIELEGGGIVLVRRRNPPPGWAIPGGFVDVGETLEEAAVREAREETGLAVLLRRQFHAYSDPSRDPRWHNVGMVFVASARGVPRGMDDAAEARVFTRGSLPPDLAFDHRRILEDYFDGRY
jgi:8-oxo-dGTP diphosphatase